MNEHFERIRGVALVAALALLGGAAAMEAQGDPWFAKAPPNVLKVRPYADPSKRFTIDYPAKDWTPYPGGVQSLVVFQQKKGEASVVVERQTLPSVAEQRFVNDTFISLRAEEVRSADPQSSAIEQRTIEDGEFRIAVLVYSRPGTAGPESLRTYHMLRGRHLYRIVCRAVQGKLPQYDPIFAHMAASFSAPAAS